MLWLLLCLLPLAGGGGATLTHNATHRGGHDHENVAVTTRPHIYFCRSPNMEDFTCWWHPLDNLTDGEAVTYVLTYSKDKGPSEECSDYVTGGADSCHFDSSHTTIWKMYCMNVTAVTARRNYTSQERCLDVADIVQTEAPVNLTYTLTDAGGDEMGHNAQLSWTYPVPSHLQYGWITLEYELQYRRIASPHNWKVKHPLREPRVELLGLPVDDYVVRVRCRSQNYGLWSHWSSALLMSIPNKLPAGKLLLLILVSGVGILALLVIAFGVIPQSRRIKDYFLPPIPKPRIMGIDPLLLKKGNLDEINRHLSNFHSYKPPSYTEEVWDHVSADSLYLTTPKDYSIPAAPTDWERDALVVPCVLTPVAIHRQLAAQNPAPYMQSMSPYCSPPPDAFAPAAPSLWTRPGIEPLPGTDYSLTGHGNSSTAPDAAAVVGNRSPQDFYTCVQLMNVSGEVHLVPCLPPQPYCREFPPLPRVDVEAGEKEETQRKLAEYQARKNLMAEPRDAGKA